MDNLFGYSKRDQQTPQFNEDLMTEKDLNLTDVMKEENEAKKK